MDFKNILLIILCFYSLQSFSQVDTVYENVTGVLFEGFVEIRSDSFVMGNEKGKKDARFTHLVKLDTYSITQYEVTQYCWYMIFRKDTLESGYCHDCPIYNVSTEEVQAFFDTLNTWFGMNMAGYHYRLPTEAEWEYAAMGGAQTKNYKYSGSNTLDSVAWNKDNAGGKTHPVGQKKPNELGLYDMSGNVWELCSDYYDAHYYQNSPVKNPANRKKAKYYVVRGGSWRSGGERCQSKTRNRNIHDHNIANCGFRMVGGY